MSAVTPADQAAIAELARVFDVPALAEEAAQAGQDLAAFQTALLARLAAGREPVTWPYTYPLRKPAEVFGQTYSAITLREPTAADLLKCGMFDGDVAGERLLDLVAELAKMPPAAVRALPGGDMIALTSRLGRIFRQAAS